MTFYSVKYKKAHSSWHASLILQFQQQHSTDLKSASAVMENKIPIVLLLWRNNVVKISCNGSISLENPDKLLILVRKLNVL